MEELKCPICGEPTSVYMGNARKDRLCRKHAQMLKNGELAQCESCGEWYVVADGCKCKKENSYVELPKEGFNKCLICGAETNGTAFCKECWKKNDKDDLLKILNVETKKQTSKNTKPIENDSILDKEIKNTTIIIDENNKSKCIACGKKTDGLLFCATCYHKYKNKELLFKVTHCTNIEMLDNDYEGRYVCKDGHVVKSKSEREIDNYLFENNITHAYEKELPYGASEKEVITPDFFLPNYLGEKKHAYIEHWGYNENNLQYTKTKKFKMPIYKNLKITLINTYEKTDMGKIESVLERKLDKKFIKENEINFEE